MKSLITLNDKGDLVLRSHRGEIKKALADSVVCCALDCSSSMAGGKIEQGKSGLLDFADQVLREGWEVALVAFGSEATCAAKPTRELSVLRERVNRLIASGSTDMCAGIRLATSELLEQEARRRVIMIVTDGQPNSRDDALIAAGEAKEIGVQLLAIGTDDADLQFLRQLVGREALAVWVESSRLRAGIGEATKLLPPS